jgi:hypothetical protein
LSHTIQSCGSEGFSFGPYAKEEKWNKYIYQFMEFGIGQLQGDLLGEIFGIRTGAIIDWGLRGPNIYNGQNSLDVMFEQKKESLFNKYNSVVKPYLNQNSRKFHNIMIKREFPIFLKIDINN